MQLPPLPTLKEFVVSAGFGGAMALLAAILAALVVLYAARRAAKSQKKQLTQQGDHHQERLAEERRSAAVTRCWDRLVWLVTTANADPGTARAGSANLALSPQLAYELLQSLERDAQEHADESLAKAINVYRTQFAFVLAQQSGRHAQPTAAHAQPTAATAKAHD
jgi:hypothetical protein